MVKVHTVFWESSSTVSTRNPSFTINILYFLLSSQDCGRSFRHNNNATIINNLIVSIRNVGKYAKTDLAHNQLWYNLDDDRTITVNKVFRCAIKNDAGEYIQIPRLTNQEIKQFYSEASANTTWTEV